MAVTIPSAHTHTENVVRRLKYVLSATVRPWPSRRQYVGDQVRHPHRTPLGPIDMAATVRYVLLYAALHFRIVVLSFGSTTRSRARSAFWDAASCFCSGAMRRA